MQIKIHESYRTIVSICDSDLIGKTFEEGNKRIEIKESFFKGDEKDKDEVIKILKDMEKDDATFNIVGKVSVECGLQAGVISKSGIITIDKIPIALILM